MSVPDAIDGFSAEEGLTFLEYLAHDLTVAVRQAAAPEPARGHLSDEESRRAMYWLNEALHNVVQLTRNLRIGREKWDSDEARRWLELWLGYDHAGRYVETAVEWSIRRMAAER